MTMLLAPDRTYEQRMDALELANQIRFARATLKRDMAAGAEYLHLLADPPGWLLSMRAEAFLCAIPKIGTWNARRILRGCMVSPDRTLGGMTARQRLALVEALEARTP